MWEAFCVLASLLARPLAKEPNTSATRSDRTTNVLCITLKKTQNFIRKFFSPLYSHHLFLSFFPSKMHFTFHPSQFHSLCPGFLPVHISCIFLEILLSPTHFSLSSSPSFSVPHKKPRTLKYATTTSFHVLYNSQFTNNPSIESHIINPVGNTQ